MEKIKRTLFSPRDSLSNNWAVGNMVVIIVMMAVYLLYYVIPAHMLAIWYRYGFAAIAVLITIYLYHQRFSGTIEIKIMALYTVWVVITRWLNHDALLDYEEDTIYNCIFSFLIFSAPILLNREQRLKALDWALAIIGGFTFLLAAAGIYVALTGATLYAPLEKFCVEQAYSAGQYIIMYFTLHRNDSAIWFFTGFVITFYQFFSCKKKIWRVPITIAAITNFTIVALEHSRTTQAAMALSIGMLIFLVVQKYIKTNSKVRMAALMIVLVPVMAVLSYKAADLATVGMSRLSAITMPIYEKSHTEVYDEVDWELSASAEEDASSVVEVDTDEPDEVSTGDFSDTRSFTNDLTTFSNRTSIWKSIFPVAKNTPIIMLKGTISKFLMEEPHKYISFAAAHMHNFLLQVLMLTGIPGFLMVLVLCAILSYHMLKLIFAKNTDVDISIKMLTIPVFGYFLRDMMEIGLFTSTNQSCQAFFLIAGMAMAMYYDVFPAKRHS